MSDVSYRFSPDDVRLRTAVGIREPTVIRIPMASGTALYGPYIDLLAGRYEAVIRFDPDIACRGRAIMDVCAGVGTERLAWQLISADQIVADDMSARLEFSCVRAAHGVEIRLLAESEFSAGIVSVEIGGELAKSVSAESLPAEPASELLSVTISDLPEPSVENSIRKGRNLYEGYQRGIGLAFSNLGARIAADPDFGRARTLAGSRTIVGDANLANIFLLIKFFLPRLPFGHIVEFGSYKGGSAIFMATLAQKFLPGVQVIGFDTFGGMPTTDRAVDAHRAGSFSDVDLTELCQYVKGAGLQNLQFVKGYFEETAAAMLNQQHSVSFSHIDCDIRSAVEYAYDITRPYMVPGGYWVFDDPFVADCVGAAEAVEDLLIKRDGLNSEQLYPHYVFREPFEKVLRP
jgi:Macrocin-O-methyltransferase (TylF)